MVHFEPPHFGLGLGARRMILAYFVLWWTYFQHDLTDFYQILQAVALTLYICSR